MADEADRGQEREAFFFDLAYKNRQHLAEGMYGPPRCGRCNYPNDRARAGYAVCSDCYEILKDAEEAAGK